ncbi:MAG TPA: VWA domain-containing protein [Bryobacteraceae bacterium]|jgi:VWFA-related protein|nr:VWA domain-containing protein [Bryobacteraceae bacterium]
MANWPAKCGVVISFFFVAALSIAQTLPPGQLPPGPPPQPGQLGPPPKPVPKTATEPPPRSMEPASPVDPAVEENRIRIGVRYVLVPVTVLDPDGHGYVNGLKTSDFELFDNNHLQKINTDFSEQPLSVVLVVQANADIEPLLPQIRRSGTLIHGLVTGQEGDVAILAFDHRMQHLQDFTSDPQKIDDAMQKITAGSSTAALIDAVVEADHMLKRHDPRNVRHRVIILLSRNVDKGSEAHLQETIRDMQFDNIIVYPVDISKVLTAVMKKPGYPRPPNGGIPSESMPNIRGNGAPNDTMMVQTENGNVLNAIPPLLHSIHDLFKRSPAEAFAYFTGGRIYSFATEHGLEAAITDIGKDLNSQYLLSYNPNDKEEPGFHNIRVNVNRPGLVVRARPGYWWGGGKQ